MKTPVTHTHQLYILVIVIMVLLTLLIVACLTVAGIKLHSFEKILVVMPLLNALVMGLAVPAKVWSKEIFRREL